MLIEGTKITEFHGEDSFMAKQGFKVGDVIQQWESITYPHQYEVGRRMERVRPGLDIYTRVRRNDTYLEKIFKAPPRPAKGTLRFGVSYHSNGSRSCLVHYVEPGSLADRLGLKEGDFIASWQGKEDADQGFIHDLFDTLNAGDELTAKVYRNGNLINLATVVGEKRTMGKVH